MADVEQSVSGWGPELVIGLVTPVGTDASELASNVRGALSNWNYRSTVIRLSDFIPSSTPPVDEPEDHRVKRLITAGNEFCAVHEDPAAIAWLAIREIRNLRVALHRQDGSAEGAEDLAMKAHPRSAYILQSLKRPGEVETLREVYGGQLLVFASQDPLPERRAQLAGLPLSSTKPEDKERIADELIDQDARDDLRTGQNITKTYPTADFFVPRRNPAREIDILFGSPDEPSIGEFAMFLARAASARSLAASRKVGAVVVAEGHVVATGYNDVPQGQEPDIRIGNDFSEDAKRASIKDTLERLSAKHLVSEPVDDVMVTTALEALDNGDLLNVIEFQRAVHAEASAINEAAILGNSSVKADLYVTTYPCHLCYKQALSAQIKHVFYIDPYPKSRATEMYPVGQVECLQPYVGIAPRRFMSIFHDRAPFSAGPDGKFPELDHETALPQVQVNLEDEARNELERFAVSKLKEEYQ